VQLQWPEVIVGASLVVLFCVGFFLGVKRGHMWERGYKLMNDALYLTVNDKMILRREEQELRELLREFASSPATFEDPRVRYVEVQVDKALLERAEQKLSQGGKVK